VRSNGNNRLKYTNLGTTGLKVSRICLGTMSYGSKKWREWVLEEADALPFYQRAIELGINFFDTADMYSTGVCEEITGRALKQFGGGRDKMVIATKLFSPMSTDPNDQGLSRKHILASVDASLKRLGTDYIDLYQIHRFDPNTPIEETLAALDSLVQCGKVRYLGASSMWAFQFAKMLYTADKKGLTRFATMQNYYNVMYREEEREMIPLCLAEGVGLIPYSPLARGFVIGNRNRTGGGETTRANVDEYTKTHFFRDTDFAIVDRVTEVAAKRGVNNAQLAMAWVLHQKVVSAPIVGATKVHHLEDAVAALDIQLEAAELKALNEPYQPRPVVMHK
jgi:1-deoxyxylulose-5-phosphate synthase